MALHEKHCKPCEGKAATLSTGDEDRLLAEVKWEISREGIHRIRKTFKFRNFDEAMDFVNRVAGIAREEDHHPTISISYNRVMLELYTHAIEGLSENDFIVAAKIDRVAGPVPA